MFEAWLDIRRLRDWLRGINMKKDNLLTHIGLLKGILEVASDEWDFSLESDSILIRNFLTRSRKPLLWFDGLLRPSEVSEFNRAQRDARTVPSRKELKHVRGAEACQTKKKKEG